MEKDLEPLMLNSVVLLKELRQLERVKLHQKMSENIDFGIELLEQNLVNNKRINSLEFYLAFEYLYRVLCRHQKLYITTKNQELAFKDFREFVRTSRDYFNNARQILRRLDNR